MAYGFDAMLRRRVRFDDVFADIGYGKGRTTSEQR
jgi:hypothetical protein